MLYSPSLFKNTSLKNTSIAAVTSLIILLLSSASTSLMASDENAAPLTKVYKVINADGSVSFSDQPVAQSETILVPPVTTVPAIDPNKANSASSNTSSNDQLDAYTSLAILAPANESAFYSASGEVDVIIDVKPALFRGDKLAIYLNDKLIKTDRQLQARLPQVNRGTHQLRVKLLSSDGKVIKESQSSFTVHKPIVRRPGISN